MIRYRRRRNVGQLAMFARKARTDDQLPRTVPSGVRPNGVEVFAGGGLLALAAEIEGVNVEIHCEQDRNAVQTLKRNLDSTILTCDVTQLELEADARGCDLFLGGPPCQPWSRAAKIQGGVGADDPRNLWPEMLRVISELRPRIVLLENVDNILSAEHSRYLGRPDHRIPGTWWDDAEAIGYEGTIYRLQAADFGTPQNRIRVWQVLWPRGAPWGDALRRPPVGPYGDPRKPQRAGQAAWIPAFERLQAGCCGGFRLVTCERLGNLDRWCESCDRGENFRLARNEEGGARLDADKAAQMMETLEGGQTRLQKHAPVDAGGILLRRPKAGERRVVGSWLAAARTKAMKKGIVPSRVATIEGPGELSLSCPIDRDAERLRELTVREAAKLQDVPQWWVFEGSRAQQYAQVGNGIPVNMGRAVVRHALRALRPNVRYPLRDSLAERQDLQHDQGLWPMDSASPVCGWSRADVDDRRRAFPGGDPNLERRELETVRQALEALSDDPSEVLGYEPEEDSEDWSLEELGYILSRYTDTGADYGVPSRESLVSVLEADPRWTRTYGGDDSWTVQYPSLEVDS